MIAITSIVVIVGVVWIGILSLAPPDKEKMEKYLKRDMDDMVLIINYFSEFDNYPIIIRKNDKINDKTVEKAVHRLFKKHGYKTIGKENNTIYFKKWVFLVVIAALPILSMEKTNR